MSQLGKWVEVGKRVEVGGINSMQFTPVTWSMTVTQLRCLICGASEIRRCPHCPKEFIVVGNVLGPEKVTFRRKETK